MPAPRIWEFIDWPEFKSIVVDKKNLTLQYKDEGDRYEIWANDAGIEYYISLSKITPTTDPSDQKDFEDNHMPVANFATGQRPYPFATGDFEFDGHGVMGTAATADTETNIDMQVAAERYTNGGMLMVSGSVLGDYISASVYDKDSLVPEPYRAAYPQWPVLKPWITKWYVPEVPTGQHSQPIMIQTKYAGIVPAGMYMRLTYHKAAGHEVKVAVNYFMHEAI